MNETPDTSIELARWFDDSGNQLTTTIQQYLGFVEDEDTEEIAKFIHQRLFNRYLKPFLLPDEKFKKYYKNGFSIMANCCLLIETLQSFKNGWENTEERGKSTQAFKQFFETESEFSVFNREEFSKRENSFYKNIRCGILHQGEVTGGWRINRDGGTKIFNTETLEIDSVAFARALERSLKSYSDNLKNAEWDSEPWDLFQKKMRRIIANCKKPQ